MSLFAFDACVNFCLLSPSTGFFLFFVAQKGVCISGREDCISIEIEKKKRGVKVSIRKVSATLL